ncbi:PTS system, cellobiose-specific IIA component [Paenibacillus sophorae]|uniref:PTS lactose/cellobiose transporter subunit IIA n=1 Tax=Paenibacillus sophorae TaxID=1333845 RepID=A0A1H8UG94_9BACL|nr:PTS lactose/cellobiose transporter subunit IIA [Paenibacillus sophorae]QWU13139.1 PTS lactose/cellobiose transporter subunit IIA [Paenibacillus sophorae]SEP02250.1 PTS system, cellobiose-specific IIA component [Paenibacillus sophorae]
MENMEVIMGIIMNAGDAKSSAVEAIQAAKNGEFEKAEELLQHASSALVGAHRSQTSLLTKAAQGDKVEITIYMVHAQDHLMTTIAFNDLAKELVDLYKKLA